MYLKLDLSCKLSCEIWITIDIFRLSLTLNGRQVGHAWADTNGYQSASNSVALALRRGDRVALLVTEGRLYEPTSTDTGYTTFTGYKIQ